MMEGFKKTKMKITIIGPAHPLRGGLASYNERIAKAFQDEASMAPGQVSG